MPDKTKLEVVEPEDTHETPESRSDGLERTADGKVKTLHSPEGISESQLFFNEARVHDLLMEYQRTESIEVWHKIALETMPLIDTIIRHYGFQKYDELDCLRSECVIKLSKLLKKYDPARGRCFTHFSVSFKHFLISYAQKTRNKQKLVSIVDEEILENTEAKTYIPADISEEFKAKVFDIDTRFTEPGQMSGLKFLINYFLLEGFGTSKTKLCHTLVSVYSITQDQAYLLYDYALIKLRSVLYEYYTPKYSDVELLRISRRWSLLPDIAETIGMASFEKLANLFGGITITFPSQKDMARLRTERTIVEAAETDASYATLHELGAASGANEGNAIFDRLGKAALEGHYDTVPLYGEELSLREAYNQLEPDPEE